MSNSPYIPNSIRSRKPTTWGEVAGICALAVLAIPALAILVFAFTALLAAVGSVFVLAAVNWGLVTAGHIFGFSVVTIGLVEAFKLSFIMQAVGGIIGGMRAASNSKS